MIQSVSISRTVANTPIIFLHDQMLHRTVEILSSPTHLKPLPKTFVTKKHPINCRSGGVIRNTSCEFVSGSRRPMKKSMKLITKPLHQCPTVPSPTVKSIPFSFPKLKHYPRKIANSGSHGRVHMIPQTRCWALIWPLQLVLLTLRTLWERTRDCELSKHPRWQDYRISEPNRHRLY